MITAVLLASAALVGLSAQAAVDVQLPSSDSTDTVYYDIQVNEAGAMTAKLREALVIAYTGDSAQAQVHVRVDETTESGSSLVVLANGLYEASLTEGVYQTAIAAGTEISIDAVQQPTAQAQTSDAALYLGFGCAEDGSACATAVEVGITLHPYSPCDWTPAFCNATEELVCVPDGPGFGNCEFDPAVDDMGFRRKCKKKRRRRSKCRQKMDYPSAECVLDQDVCATRRSKPYENILICCQERNYRPQFTDPADCTCYHRSMRFREDGTFIEDDEPNTLSEKVPSIVAGVVGAVLLVVLGVVVALCVVRRRRAAAAASAADIGGSEAPTSGRGGDDVVGTLASGRKRTRTNPRRGTFNKLPQDDEAAVPMVNDADM